MLLSDAYNARDNNFNLIRMLAALGVLVAHSFALSLGPGGENSAVLFGFSFAAIGDVSVHVFFVVSGFLITSSLVSKDDLKAFYLARVLRIFPALWAMLIITVLGIGTAYSTLPAHEYFLSADLYIYLAKTGTLIANTGISLPGVFHNNPHRYAFNGSLWTLPYEIWLYIALGMFWICASKRNTKRKQTFLAICLCCVFATGISTLIAAGYPSGGTALGPFTGKLLFLSYMFFSGATYYLLRAKILLSPMLFWLFIGALVATSHNSSFNTLAYNLALPYLTMYAAFFPSGTVRLYNRLGDYSYGLYIYAFPVQQAIASSIPCVSVSKLTVTSFLITGVFAVLSWHLLEQRALRLRKIGG